MNIDITTLQNYIADSFSEVKIIKKVNPSNFIFEERVKQKCFHCVNYKSKWTCPPNIPDVNYVKMFSEYSNAVILKCELDLTNSNFDENRTISTNKIHKALLYLEEQLFKNNEVLAISFIGGSCKLCKNCPDTKCAYPYLSRMPIEATGCNVIESFKLYGIEISFPLKDKFFRYGLLMW